MTRGFWFSRLTTVYRDWTDPLTGIAMSRTVIVPEVVDTARADGYGQLRWRAIPLQTEQQRGTADGWCVVGTGQARAAWQNKPRVWGLGTSLDSVRPDDFVDAVNQQFGRSYPYGRTVRDLARYVLRRVPVAGALQPSADGRFRIALDAGDEDTAAPPVVDHFDAADEPVGVT